MLSYVNTYSAFESKELESPHSLGAVQAPLHSCVYMNDTHQLEQGNGFLMLSGSEDRSAITFCLVFIDT